MDSFELNKVMGAILGTLLFTLALNIVSGGIFASHAPHKAGYEIAAKDDKGGQQQAAVEPQVPLENLLNEANPEKGASIARQCVACHDFAKGGPNKVGPNLYGVVNRDSASHEGFNYSNAMKAKKAKWTFEAIDKFLENPSKVVPGTSMTFLGLRKATDRAAVIAYLNKQADAPAPLPKPVAVNATPDEQKKDGDKKDAEKKDAPKQKDAEKKDAPAAEKKEMPAEKKDAPAPAEKKDAPAKQ